VRSRRGLNKIGVLALALLIALGAMGVAYAAWIDEVYIEGTISTGDINTSLTCSTPCCSVTGNPAGADTSITCGSGTETTLNITVVKAQFSTDPETHYYCSFDVSNAAGSFPIKIKTLSITDPYTGVTRAIEDLAVGDVIDPTKKATGKVHIQLTTAEQAGKDLGYTLTVTVKRWNEA